ncbi:hypothetical protein F4561_004537 [Lipingzhangella halophila]|uniref:Cell wall-active antibiotics response 4TMS YvqF n=1 Tax=Lipingzhangella halophila TaxID=1783352 RepID=A0A7W7W445_9ACTN|nr:DUF1707 domain-containing protein [Lipingzhangella halophila]MBB4933717.1 hypothetical protein [Lipingzhangella halophila]
MADTADTSTPDESGGHRIRASDSDRDAVAARLRDALAEGRLSPDEHSERLDAVYGAKTRGELEPLTTDLPDSAAPAREAASAFPSPRPVYGAERIVNNEASGAVSIAVMGGAERSGHWTVPARYVATAVMGGIGLDLREALFTQREVTIFAVTLMGGIEIIVPDDVEVRVHGAGVMGGFGSSGEVATPSVTDPGTPIVHIAGLAVMGGVGVERRKRKHQKRREIDSSE